MAKVVLLCLIWTGLLYGCSAVTPYAEQPLHVDVPEQWQAEGTVDAAISREPTAWLHDFDSVALHNFVAVVLANNIDIKTAAARMELSRQALEISSGQRWPQLTVDLKQEKTHSEKNGDSFHEQTLSVLASVTWELDLWGRLADLVRADGADYRAAAHDFQSVRLSFVAQTVRAWLRSVAAGRSLSLVQQTCASLQVSEEHQQRYYERGLIQAEDVRQLRDERLRCEEQLSELARRQREELRQLQLLAGVYPAANLLTDQELPLIDTQIPAGLPATLLERRPDILAAKERIVALDARTLAAQKKLLPTLSLTASGGLASSDLHNLLRHGGSTWDLVSNLTLPLFQGGALRGQIAVNSSQARLAWLDYKKTVLNAFAEVESALDKEQDLCRREQGKQRDLAHAVNHEQTLWQHYLSGDESLTRVLAARRQILTDRRDLLELKTERLLNRVQLHLALGGSFSVSQELISRI